MKRLLLILAAVMFLVAGLCPLLDAQNFVCDQYGCRPVASQVSYGYAPQTYGSTVYSQPGYSTNGYASSYGPVLTSQPMSYSDGNCAGYSAVRTAPMATYGSDDTLWKDPTCAGTFRITPVYSAPMSQPSVYSVPMRPIYGYQKTRVTPFGTKTVQRSW